MTTLQARDAKDVEAAVQWLLAESKAAEIVGHGSKRTIGRPAQTDVTLDLSALSGVTLYEPEELVLSAHAGTPLAEIEALVAAQGQQLAFEPMDCAGVLGGAAGRGTVGGMLAANLSGPRRIKAGAARDHLLGFVAVSGRGESFKSGGRVVKNVTGYDLCKLMAGSWGTLAAMTEVTLKVLPAPETEETVLIRGLEPGKAIEAMTGAVTAPCDVSGAAHLPAEVAARLPAGSAASGGGAVTALRLEGFAPSVAHRRGLTEALMKPFGELVTLDAPASRTLWKAVRDADPLGFAHSIHPPLTGEGRIAEGDSSDPHPIASRSTSPLQGEVTRKDERALWRISTAPSRGAELGALIARAAEAQMLYDWAGGLLWLALEASEDAGAALVRQAVAATGGHATLIRAPAAVRAKVDVFTAQDAAVAALTKRIKAAFDPSGVLNPGRMWAGV